MKKLKMGHRLIFLFLISLCAFGLAQQNSVQQTLDEKVESFLESQRGKWDGWNVPEADGKLLYNLIVENNYTSALEIGTSTGHSAIWMAWALSKTGGKLITIEINEKRYKEALANFEAAGLADFVDARLADAHKLVKELPGPFDFVFSDADKGWYTNYFKDVYPRLKIGGCYTAHNISRRGGMGGTSEFYEYVKNLKDMETTLDSSGNGLSISYKRALQ